MIYVAGWWMFLGMAVSVGQSTTFSSSVTSRLTFVVLSEMS